MECLILARLNNDTAIYELTETKDERFEIHSLPLPGNL